MEKTGLEVHEANKIPVSLENTGVEKPVGPVKWLFWNTGWVSIMDADGDKISLDLDPAPGGTIGQVIQRSHEVGPEKVLAPSFKIWLSDYARDLKANKYRYDAFSCMLTRIKE